MFKVSKQTIKANKIYTIFCFLSGYISNEEIKSSTFFFSDLVSTWSLVSTFLIIMALFWKHYGVEVGLGDGQDP